MKTIKILSWWFETDKAAYCRVRKNEKGQLFLTYLLVDKVTEIKDYDSSKFQIDIWIKAVKAYIKANPKKNYTLWNY